MRIVFCLFSLFLSIQTYSQSVFPYISFPVNERGQDLKMPFAGGLNAGQYSMADLNKDGLQDMVVFDRVGDILLPFIASGSAGNIQYQYSPEFAAYFPIMSDFMLMRDYNKDGAADIFMSSVQPGSREMEVYQGYYENNTLKFKALTFKYPNCTYCLPQLIYYPDNNNPGLWVNLAVSKADIPEIDDIDGDGDLDILTFEATVGGYMWYFENQSVERGFGLDSLQYKLVDLCWGNFYESGVERCYCIVSKDKSMCALPQAPEQMPDNNRHAGSTTMSYDHDGDGDKEVVLGDINFDCLNYLRNDGTKKDAFIQWQDTLYPQYTTPGAEPVLLPSFPAAFYLDVDQDGKKDLVVAPNQPNIGEDRFDSWYYRNTASTGHDFQLQTRQFLVDDMIDVGTISHPAIADINADGLLDLVVGNYGYYTRPTPNNASLYLYLNVGTPTEPRFKLTDSTWLDLHLYAPVEYDFAPTFGDLDSDGDLDLLIGTYQGSLFYYKNVAPENSPAQYVRDQDLNWILLDPGLLTIPFIYDLDNDGLQDILVGERNGNINFYRNQGSPTEPVFSHPPTLEKIGNINTTATGEFAGNSAPVVVTPFNSQPVLITGAANGKLQAYTMPTATNNAYTLLSDFWGRVDVGSRSHPALADLDNDGKQEMIIGNQRGGLSLFRTDLPATYVSVKSTPEAMPVQIRPNPARDRVFVQLDTKGTAVSWTIRNSLGQTVASGQSPTDRFELDTSKFPAGIYQLECLAGNRLGVARLVLQDR